MIKRNIVKNTLILLLFTGLIFSCQTSCKEKPNENKSESIEKTELIIKKYDRFDLAKYEKIDLSEKKRLMDQVKDLYPQYSMNNNWLEEYLDHFHFIDLDSDGDKDLIYNGWSGGEPMMVQISLNVNSVFKTKFTDFINLIDLKFDNGKLSELTIHDPGCCGAIMEYDIKYQCITGKDSIDCWIVELIEYHNETTKPDKYFEKPKKFEVVNTPYTLRITPGIDTNAYYFPDETKGNVIKIYSAGDKGVAFAEKSDETGRIWWYVIMDRKKKTDGKIRSREDYEPKLKGWMSSRYLKKI